MKRQSWTAWLVAPVVLVLGLSACGGGDGGAADNVPPPSATASEAGYVAYTASVANTPTESAPDDPVDLTDFTPPPFSEDSPPIATSADEKV